MPGSLPGRSATAVDCDESHGADLEVSQIDLARAGVQAGSHHNATLHVSDAGIFPLGDNFFEVARCHAVFMHVPDTPGTLSEGERILKAGGIISSRELIVDSSFLDPSTENTGAAWATFANPLEANGGRPQIV